MNTSTKFRVGFHITHPSISANEIESMIALPTKYSYSVGMQKKTKSGNLLNGVYKETNITFILHDKPLCVDDVSMEKFIDEQLELLNCDYLKELSTTGGVTFFLLGIFCQDNVMYYFEPKLLSKLSTNNIGLKIDIYGGPGP